MRWILALAALSFVVFFTGCEKSDPVADADNLISVFADPSNVPLNIQGEGKSTITAEVVDKNGGPEKGIAITFTTDGGTLASNGERKKTDSNGRVQDTLTVTTDQSGDTVKVTAVSGRQKGEVSVTVAGADEPPQALMTISPLPDAHINTPVTFDGSRSRDDVRITQYRWTLVSTNPDATIPPELAGKCTRPIQPSQEICNFQETTPGTAQSIFTRNFTNAQDVTITLDVFDTLGQIDSTALVTPLSVVANFAPTANAGADLITTLGTGFFMSAVTSSDPDGTIKRYDWDMGDGTLYLNRPDPTNSHAYQTYAVCGAPPVQAPGCAFDVKLTVFDNGTPSVPGYTCALNLCTGYLTAQDNLKVSVFAPAGP